MIKHIKCDIFESGADIICHQVNCQGAMNSGVAKQVREKYPEVYRQYRRWCEDMNFSKALLGKMQFVNVSDGKMIINLFAQHKYGYDGDCYTDYEALEKTLTIVDAMAHKATIAIPYLMGCHRGGGDWNIVYTMIEKIFKNSENDVLICEYNGG